MWTQLVQPNLTVTGQVGWCLAYARQVFGVGALYPTAWQGWLNTKYKHLDRNFPNVAVPCWFTYKTLGHVVIYVPNKGFYSSPYTSTQSHYVGASVQDIEAKYSCRYLGWSEDINNVRVAQEVSMNTIPDTEDYYWRYGKDLALKTRGRELSRMEFQKALVGKTDLQAVEILSDDKEAVIAQGWQDTGKIAVTENWEKQIKDLQATVAKQSSQILGLAQTVNDKELEIEDLQDVVAQLQEENKELKAELALVSQDTANLNKLGESLMWFLTRLGIKK